MRILSFLWSEVDILDSHLNKIPMLLSQKELRDGRRYKQIDIANGTGLSVSVVSRIMNDRSIGGMTYATAKAFAKWLGVSMEELGQEEISE
jgi:transcriptional regulator with XRE-family HTH domain